MQKQLHKTLTLTTLFLFALSTYCTSQESVSKVKFGDFEQWTVREIKESGIIGGKTKTVYVIGPNETIKGEIPYKYGIKTQWGSSNVMAKVMGIVKTSNTVFPEKRGEGLCARLDTKFEMVKVLGLIDISVIASGSIFLGEILEPIKSVSNPYSKINMGVPFKGRPKTLIFDYKAKISDDITVKKCAGFGTSVINGHDEADIYVLLQQRWEDSDGNIYAKRIATGRERFGKTVTQWINNHRIPILYGDITKLPSYKAYMGLLPENGSFNAKNSKGEMVPIKEIEWGNPDDEVTHMILMISSGCYGAFIGTVGNSLWVDNVRLAY